MITLLRPVLGAALLLLVPCVVAAQGTLTPAPSPTPSPAPIETVTPPAVTPPGAPAAAEGERPMAACRTDAEALCPGTAKGERRKCLDDNAAKLSPACTAARTDIAAKAKALSIACQGDVKSHCAGIQPGDGKLMQCLRTNVAKLSPTCNTAVKARFPNG